MQNRLMVCLMAIALTTFAFAQEKPAQAADSYAGTWAGTWRSEDGASGGVEITFEKGTDGKPAGKVKTSGGEVDHSAPFKSLSVDGKKVTGKYDYPLEGGGEITMEGTLDATTAKGTWVLRQTQGTAAVDQGTWTATKK
jgi:hypothetical protein